MLVLCNSLTYFSKWERNFTTS